MRRLKLWWPRSPESAEGGARTSIANRLRWSYLISSTLPLLLVGALLLKINTDAQQGRIYSDQKGLASRVARDISRYVANLQNQFDLRMSPSAAIDQSVEQLTDVASNLEVRNAPNLIDLSVLDPTNFLPCEWYLEQTSRQKSKNAKEQHKRLEAYRKTLERHKARWKDSLQRIGVCTGKED